MYITLDIIPVYDIFVYILFLLLEQPPYEDIGFGKFTAKSLA